MKKLVKKASAVSHVLGANIGPGIRVLCYHTVVDGWQNRAVQWPIAVSLGAFERHVDYLRNQYEVISLDQINDALALPARDRDRCICLTFDDGYLSNYEIAWPVLKAAGLPMAIFASTAYVGTNRFMPASMLRMVFAHVREKHIEVAGR